MSMNCFNDCVLMSVSLDGRPSLELASDMPRLPGRLEVDTALLNTRVKRHLFVEAEQLIELPHALLRGRHGLKQPLELVILDHPFNLAHSGSEHGRVDVSRLDDVADFAYLLRREVHLPFRLGRAVVGENPQRHLTQASRLRLQGLAVRARLILPQRNLLVHVASKSARARLEALHTQQELEVLACELGLQERLKSAAQHAIHAD
eukprot:scaffold442_cov268-Pinguiococcus_pyrenoidosus.AAC.19